MRSCLRPLVGLALISVFAAGAALVGGCADEPTAAPVTTMDGGSADAGGSRADASAPVAEAGADGAAPLPTVTETEPNDGTTETETNAMSAPGRMNAAIDPADDRDIFTVSVVPGELWQWTITPKTADLAPHLAVFDIAPDNLNPSRVIAGTAGAPATLEHFVLRPGAFVAGVRDARNVPTPTGKGGPTYGYTLEAVKKAPAPIAVTFPSQRTATLPSAGALDLYAFTATKGTVFGIVIKAERKAQPSTLDSRLSLFHTTTGKAIITNDNAGASKDSQVGGQLPEDGAYLAIVEHEGTDASDLSYEIVFQTTEP